MLAGLAGSGCSAIAGLDGINESACAPYCGTEEAGLQVTDDASVEGGAGGSLESGVPNEAAATMRDTGVDPPESGAGVDASSFEDQSAPETGPRVDSGRPEMDSATPPVDTGSPMPEAGKPDTGGGGGPCGTVFFQDHFSDSAKGWTLDGTGTWAIGQTCANPPAPAKGNADPTVDHTSGNAGGVLGAYLCGNNPTGATVPARYALSPVVDTTSASSLQLTFYRWLNTDAGAYMVSTVDVFDGTAWHTLYTNPTPAGQLVTDGVWTLQTFDVTAYKSAAFQVRFGVSIVAKGVYVMSSWNVDDVTLSTLSCP